MRASRQGRTILVDTTSHKSYYSPNSLLGALVKTMTAVEAKNSFGQLLEAALREPVAVTKNRREVAAMFSMEDVRALADSFLAAPLKADVEAGKISLLDALMAQVDINRRLEDSRKAITAGDGIVADPTYFAALRDRALRRVS